MKVLIVSGIHANWVALQAVLTAEPRPREHSLSRRPGRLWPAACRMHRLGDRNASGGSLVPPGKSRLVSCP